MSAEKPLYEQIAEFRDMYQELWWKMADGEAVAYREIKRLPVFEFWGFFDKWRERNQQKIEQLQKQNRERQR